jgi:hypothetical protein
MAAAGHLYVIALPLQRGGDHGPDVRLVIHHQDARRPARPGTYMALCCSGQIRHGIRCFRFYQV